MRVLVVERIERDEVEVYLFEYANVDDRIPFRVGSDRRLRTDEPQPVSPGEEMRPALVLRSNQYAALVEAIRAQGPLGSVEAEALADARAVRDRLLSLVELAQKSSFP